MRVECFCMSVSMPFYFIFEFQFDKKTIRCSMTDPYQSLRWNATGRCSAEPVRQAMYLSLAKICLRAWDVKRASQTEIRSQISRKVNNICTCLFAH